MNIRDVVPITSSSLDRRTVAPPVASGRGDTIQNMLEVVETVHQLCSDASVNAGSIHRVASKTTVSSLLGAEKVDAAVQETTIPAFDILSNNFLQSVVNYVAGLSRLSIGLLVTSKSGMVVQSVQSGWDASEFRIQNRVLARIAKECVWRIEPRFSTNALTECQDESEIDTTIEKVEASVLLNELSKIIGTPLFAVPFPLKESSGFAVFLCEASPCVENGIVKYFSEASQIWLSKSSLESLLRQLDTWLIVRRCSWVARIVSVAELIRSHPRWWVTPIVLFCVAMLAPVPYYPRRDCVFEPETKQYLSSPIQGRIASCEVRPGDHVEKGQLMARIDDDQLRRDLATAQAEYDGAIKKRDSALATRAIGNASLAKIEMDQATRRIESIQDQLRRLEIRARGSGPRPSPCPVQPTGRRPALIQERWRPCAGCAAGNSRCNRCPAASD